MSLRHVKTRHMAFKGQRPDVVEVSIFYISGEANDHYHRRRLAPDHSPWAGIGGAINIIESACTLLLSCIPSQESCDFVASLLEVSHCFIVKRTGT